MAFVVEQSNFVCLLSKIVDKSLCPVLPLPLLSAVFLSDGSECTSWLGKQVVALILCLRDWLCALPTSQEGALDNHTLKSVFEVCVYLTIMLRTGSGLFLHKSMGC